MPSAATSSPVRASQTAVPSLPLMAAIHRPSEDHRTTPAMKVKGGSPTRPHVLSAGSPSGMPV